jgi:hypothetical protein
MAVRGFAPALASCLLAAGLTAAAPIEPVYTWMSGYGDGNASLVYGSPETGEDYVFNAFCRNGDKQTGMTVYVDMQGTRVGDPVAIEFASGSSKLSIEGKVVTDEMSGFHFAEATGFKIKPVITLLGVDGDATVTTGKHHHQAARKGARRRDRELRQGLQARLGLLDCNPNMPLSILTLQ